MTYFHLSIIISLVLAIPRYDDYSKRMRSTRKIVALLKQALLFMARISFSHTPPLVQVFLLNYGVVFILIAHRNAHKCIWQAFEMKMPFYASLQRSCFELTIVAFQIICISKRSTLRDQSLSTKFKKKLSSYQLLTKDVL